MRLNSCFTDYSCIAIMVATASVKRAMIETCIVEAAPGVNVGGVVGGAVVPFGLVVGEGVVVGASVVGLAVEVGPVVVVGGCVVTLEDGDGVAGGRVGTNVG